MYVHLGKDVVINANNILGIFNLEFIQNTSEYRIMYESMLKNDKIIDISDDCKKTFILFKEKKEIKAYISNISATTIAKRKNFLY